VPSLHGGMLGSLDLARDPAALRAAFGITTPLPQAGNPLGVWAIQERTAAAYLQSDLSWPAHALDLQAGLRLVHTQESLAGTQSVPTEGGTAPVDLSHGYDDLLPSASLRWVPSPGWVTRLAASKTLARPSFDQLSPSLSLVPNSVNPELNQGSAGNPALRPVRSSNVDLALEYYPDASSMLSATLFWKQVDGFITLISAPEQHDGATYQVTRPENALPARVRGIELAGQAFFRGLPPGWGMPGLQANLTWIDSQMPVSQRADPTPLPNLSRTSLNLVALYESRWGSARLAANWRDRFLNGYTNVVGLGSLPIYTQGYAWVDASLRVRLNEQLTLSFEGLNLTNTLRRSYFAQATRPQGAWLDGRQFAVSVLMRL
jgi:iron complex outermembrane recepter protein